MLTRAQLAHLKSEPLIGPNKLRLARKLADATQVDLAAATGFTQAEISYLERGHRETLDNARLLARHFGCSIEDLFPAREAVAS